MASEDGLGVGLVVVGVIGADDGGEVLEQAGLFELFDGAPGDLGGDHGQRHLVFTQCLECLLDAFERPNVRAWLV